MNNKISAEIAALKKQVRQAMNAYELARLEKIRITEQVHIAHTEKLAVLEMKKTRSLQSALKDAGMLLAQEEQERLGQLLNLQQEVLTTAGSLLEKTGLAYALGAATAPDSNFSTSENPQQTAIAFHDAQLGYADLRVALFHLAEAYLRQKRWEAARRFAEVLMEDTGGGLYGEALTLFCESCFQPAEILLQSGKLEDAENIVRLALAKDRNNTKANQITKQINAKRQDLQRQADMTRRRAEEESKRLEQEKVQEPARKMLRSMALITIPGGEFLYGKTNGRVRTSEYQIGKFPVTNAQFIVFLDAVGRTMDGERNPSLSNNPVTWVSWSDAVEFCEWASKITGALYRLPTSIEWEKAARGTNGRTYPWGDQEPDANHCNFNRHVRSTTPVGIYSPRGDSPYGCCDMAGNVWEMCADHTVCGGCFNSPGEHMCSTVHFQKSNDPYYDSGFRVCVSPISR